MKAVFIDIDNTLLSFDEYVKETMQTGFAHFGLKTYEPYMYSCFVEENNKLWRQIEKETLTFSELKKIRWNLIFQRLDIDFDGTVFESYFRRMLNESAIPEAGAYNLLRHLEGDYILCVASNGPYEQQMHRLELAQMKSFFQYFFISDQVGASKPSKSFFDYAFQKLNENRRESILPQETLMIGDSLTSDISGGMQYGMKTCYYRRNKDIPVPETVDYVVDDLNQVISLLT